MNDKLNELVLMMTRADLAELVRSIVAEASRELPVPTPAGEPRKTVFNLREFAKWLGVSPRSVPRIVAREQVPHRKVGRQYRFVRAEAEAWLSGRSGRQTVTSRVDAIRMRAAR